MAFRRSASLWLWREEAVVSGLRFVIDAVAEGGKLAVAVCRRDCYGHYWCWARYWHDVGVPLL